MYRIIRIILVAAWLTAFQGCIENDIPYPVVELEIVSLEGEGFTASVDRQNRRVELTLDETTDISRVKIDRAEVTENARASVELAGTFDLRTPLEVTLSLYQDYVWTVAAKQEIERYFTVEGQIGDCLLYTSDAADDKPSV